MSQFAQEELGQGCVAAANRPLEFYLKDCPILSAFVVYFVNHLVIPPTSVPRACGWTQVLQSLPIPISLFFVQGPCGALGAPPAPWPFHLHSLHAFSCHLVGSPGVTLILLLCHFHDYHDQSHNLMAALQLCCRTLTSVIGYSSSIPPFQGLP